MDDPLMEAQSFATRLRFVMEQRNWTVSELANRTGISRRTLDAYLLREGASLPGFEALVSLSKGFGVSLDGLVLGGDLSGETVEPFTQKATCEAAHPVFELLIREHSTGKPLVMQGEVLNMSPEHWARSIACHAAARARDSAASGTGSEELKLWWTGRNARMGELLRDTFDTLATAEEPTDTE